jgi:hypothetical protein
MCYLNHMVNAELSKTVENWTYLTSLPDRSGLSNEW